MTVCTARVHVGKGVVTRTLTAVVGCQLSLCLTGVDFSRPRLGLQLRIAINRSTSYFHEESINCLNCEKSIYIPKKKKKQEKGHVKNGHHNFAETKVTSPNRHLLSNSQEPKYSSATIIKDEEKQWILTFKNLELPNVKKKKNVAWKSCQFSSDQFLNNRWSSILHPSPRNLKHSLCMQGMDGKNTQIGWHMIIHYLLWCENTRTHPLSRTHIDPDNGKNSFLFAPSDPT